MSTTVTPTASPAHVQPLHNPSQAAHVVVPQAPLGNTTNGIANQAPGLGAKALLAKKMAKNINPTFVSPTDNMMTPCTKKISAAKKKHFTKGAKPMQPLFAQRETKESESGSSEDELSSANKMDDDENPF
ncbi:hypothetical protein BDW22DRAFT_1341756 [Trametopsis cervina]|nr:hypothetical protein BDW22DRAFT_1341756 [Trametopsis cervina]